MPPRPETVCAPPSRAAARRLFGPPSCASVAGARWAACWMPTLTRRPCPAAHPRPVVRRPGADRAGRRGRAHRHRAAGSEARTSAGCDRTRRASMWWWAKIRRWPCAGVRFRRRCICQPRLRPSQLRARPNGCCSPPAPPARPRWWRTAWKALSGAIQPGAQPGHRLGHLL